MQFALPGWLRGSARQHCRHKTREPAWRVYGSPLLPYSSFPLRLLLTIYNVPNPQYNPLPTLLFPHHMYFSSEITKKKNHNSKKLQEVLDSRGPSHVFLKYMTPDTRFPSPLCNPFTETHPPMSFFQ